MKLRAIMIATAIAYSQLCATAWAQDTDLSTQRHEEQQFLPVDGEKIDHQGIIINPTPQSVERMQGQTLDISKGIKINDKSGKFANDVFFVDASGKTRLTIDFGPKAARKAGAPEQPEAYILKITKKGISITGYDEAGVFYGLQTLRQVMQSPAATQGKLPCMTVRDYPSLPLRGVVEGFYGTPWSHEVRLSLIDYFGRFKMNTYVYGPKDDPYHRSPNWRDPYPDDEASQIEELVKACRKNHVNFVWAIHPGGDIRWDEEDYAKLLHKFELMYDLGVRSFSIFFDDISGAGASPVKQTQLLNRLTREFVEAKGDVSPLIFCPTDYTRAWANPTPHGSLPYFGANLDPDIKIFWTGDVVCSDVTANTLEWVNSRIKRPALFWWNYPVTDYVRNIVLQGPIYGLDTSLTINELSGILSNPMEHGEASKLALYGVADYAWNVQAYNPIDNWERGLADLMPNAAEAYRTFAIHSCDTETGYRRDESWETVTFGIDDWNADDAQALAAEFERIERVPIEVETGCDNQLLLAELRPWLTEFGKLGTRCKLALNLIEMYRNDTDNAVFWENYIANIMSREERESYEAHKSGTMKLQPFYDNAMTDMAFRFLAKLSGQVPCNYVGLSPYPNSSTPQPQLMLDGDTTTYYTSALPQRKDSWIAVDLKTIRDVHTVKILQGRNSVDDVDYFDHAALEYSPDGKTWLPLIDDIEKQYVINWEGEAVKARYVRLKRLESKRTNYVAVRSFEVNPPSVDKLGFTLQTDGFDTAAAMPAFDLNATTAFTLAGSMTISIPDGTKEYTLLTGESPASVAVFDATGAELLTIDATLPFTSLLLPAGAATLKISGETDIYEIIPQS